MTPNQRAYGDLYDRLSKARRQGRVTDFGVHSLQKMYDSLVLCWECMSKEERRPFMAPECLAPDQDGPVNPDFRTPPSRDGMTGSQRRKTIPAAMMKAFMDGTMKAEDIAHELHCSKGSVYKLLELYGVKRLRSLANDA